MLKRINLRKRARNYIVKRIKRVETVRERVSEKLASKQKFRFRLRVSEVSDCELAFLFNVTTSTIQKWKDGLSTPHRQRRRLALHTLDAYEEMRRTAILLKAHYQKSFDALLTDGDAIWRKMASSI